jgi:preprotein translocase subunit SecA
MPTKDFGSLDQLLRFGEGRRMKRLGQQAAYVTSLEPDFEALSDAELAGKTAEFRQRLENGEELDELLFEAYGAVREAAKRALGQRPFDVQLMGGIVLHEGDIAEMKTGEGKTLVATMPLYLNSLTGTGVHLVTVNDYLAKRDAEWMGPVYEKLGVRAAFVQNMMPFAERRDSYAAEITYGTNSEFGFDYLRDNMAVALEGVVQRGHTYAIVDEVDSILVDEARTPLIISGEPETAAQLYYDFARIVRGFEGVPGNDLIKGEETDADYTFDEKRKTVSPAQGAIEKVERALRVDNLYDPRNGQLVNHLNQALKAESLYHKDVDYVVQDGEVKIVDEFTGRIMEGRRWSEGLHQAVEAKEGASIQEEHITLATITLQNYFRLYEKLGGMTGTAKTEEKEFVEIYSLHVVEIPTNVAVARRDENDFIFKTRDEKFDAVVHDIKDRGRDVRVPLAAPHASGNQAQRLEREAARAGGRDHQGRRPAGRGHDRDQHGGTWRRHQARRGRARARRPLRPRHRAPRGPPHRQPAARPLRPAGRPRRDPLLPLGSGRPRPALRGRPDLQHHGALQAPRGGAHGGFDPVAPDRGCAEEGRGAELRRAQERPQVRRRDERAATGDLRAAAERARGTGSLRGRGHMDRPGGRAHGHVLHGERAR